MLENWHLQSRKNFFPHPSNVRLSSSALSSLPKGSRRSPLPRRGGEVKGLAPFLRAPSPHVGEGWGGGWLMNSSTELRNLQEEVISCRKCPRLVEYRQEVAQQNTAAVSRLVLLVPPLAQLWGCPGPGLGHRPGPGGPGRKPYGAHVHRGPER